MIACARVFGYNNRCPEERNYRYEESDSSRRSRRRMFGVGPTAPEPDSGGIAAGARACTCARTASAGRAAAGGCPAAGCTACGATGHDHDGTACSAGHDHRSAARAAGYDHHGNACGTRSCGPASAHHNRDTARLSDLSPLRRSRQGRTCARFQGEALQALRRQGLPASASTAASSPSPLPPSALS